MSWKLLCEKHCHKQNKQKLKRNDNLRDLWENVKYTNTRNIGAPGGEKKDIEDIIDKSFPNNRKEMLKPRKCRASHAE